LKTYVKIYGPPLMKALGELQKIAGKMPKITHYHFLVGYAGGPFPTAGGIEGLSADAGLPPGATSSPEKVTHSVISKSGHALGEYDFFFEWKEDPSWDEMCDLISKIDKAFTKLRCKYTLTTK
jgi:hypothetical protein